MLKPKIRFKKLFGRKRHAELENAPSPITASVDAVEPVAVEHFEAPPDLLTEIQNQPNTVDRQLFESLRSLVPNWYGGSERDLILQIEHLLLTAPAVGDDEVWLPTDNPDQQANVIGKLNGWHQHLLKTTRGAMMETNVAARPLKAHPGLRHLLRYHRASRERTNYWGSSRLLGLLKQRQGQFLTYRIELNPAIGEQIDIFAKLMQGCENKGLAVAGSILDRRQEFYDRRRANRDRPLLATPAKRLRTDGIVLLIRREDVNDLLELSFACRREYENAFEGRSSSRLLTKIEPGLAIGDSWHFGAGRNYHPQLLATTIRLCQEFMPPSENEVSFEAFSERLFYTASVENFQEHNLAFTEINHEW